MIRRIIYPERFLRMIGESICSFAIIFILFRDVEIETLLKILRGFPGTIMMMIVFFCIFIKRNAFFLFPTMSTIGVIIDVMFPMSLWGIAMLFYSRITLF